MTGRKRSNGMLDIMDMDGLALNRAIEVRGRELFAALLHAHHRSGRSFSCTSSVWVSRACPKSRYIPTLFAVPDYLILGGWEVSGNLDVWATLSCASQGWAEWGGGRVDLREWGWQGQGMGPGNEAWTWEGRVILD